MSDAERRAAERQLAAEPTEATMRRLQVERERDGGPMPLVRYARVKWVKCADGVTRLSVAEGYYAHFLDAYPRIAELREQFWATYGLTLQVHDGLSAIRSREGRIGPGGRPDTRALMDAINEAGSVVVRSTKPFNQVRISHDVPQGVEWDPTTPFKRRTRG